MELYERDIEKLGKMPLIQTQISKSKDGTKIIHRTVITDIKDIKYYHRVFEAGPAYVDGQVERGKRRESRGNEQLRGA